MLLFFSEMERVLSSQREEIGELRAAAAECAAAAAECAAAAAGERAAVAAAEHAAAPAAERATPAPSATVLPPPIRNPARSMFDRVDRPSRAPCFYCSQVGHWSFLCTARPTIQSRMEYITKKGLQNSSLVQPSRPCEWLFCGGWHVTSICPNAVYPVTKAVQDAYYRQLNFVKIREGLLPQFGG